MASETIKVSNSGPVSGPQFAVPWRNRPRSIQYNLGLLTVALVRFRVYGGSSATWYDSRRYSR